MLGTLCVFSVILLGPALAAADVSRPLAVTGAAPTFGFVGTERLDGRVLARQVLPAPSVAPTAAFAQSRTVYLNRTGATLTPGTNDARANRSSIVNVQTSIPGWTTDTATWQSTVSCVRDLFKAYDLTIVETDPGSVPHIEAVFGGTPQQLGLDPDIIGISPFTTDCSIIENSIVFVFTNVAPMTAREACEVMAQEIAHSYGLDHEMLASDPMTYLAYTGNRSFQDVAASCGEDTARPCGINGSVCRATQNSVQLLRERIGIADPLAPTVMTLSPPANSTVPPGFTVRATATDNEGVTGALLKIDGTLVTSLTGTGPFAFPTSQLLTEGPHTLVLEISDGKNVRTETRTVTVMIGAPNPEEVEDEGPDVIGGCSTGRGAGWLVALGALFTARRRRRQGR